MTRSISVTPAMLVGYQGCGFDSPAYKLTEVYGDYLEKISSGDKLALIAVLSMWLANDDEDYALHHAQDECPMTASDQLTDYIWELREMTPDDALNLIAALTAQLKGKVFAE